MNRLKVLIFHPALAPYRIDQFNALGELYDLEVVFIFDNIWDNRFDQEKLRAQLQFKHSYLLKGPGSQSRAIRYGMLKTIRTAAPDIIFGYEYSFTTQYLLLLKRLGLISQKLGSTVDDSIEICNHIQTRIRYFARQYSVRHLDYLVVLSREVSQFYQNSFQLKDQQVIISPILQAPERLRSNAETLQQIAEKYMSAYQLKGKRVLLFVGRLILEKGMLNFLNNVFPVLLAREDTVMVIVGEGEQREEIQRLITEKNLTGKVFLPGRFEGDELNAWYLCASGFVLPSTFEPFGAVINEALIFGLKVLCSKYAGAAYLIPEGSGSLFDPLSEEQTVVATREFLYFVKPVTTAELAQKPSLMHNFKSDLVREWKKLE